MRIARRLALAAGIAMLAMSVGGNVNATPLAQAKLPRAYLPLLNRIGPTAEEQAVVDEVNTLRAQQGCQPLALATPLLISARIHAADMSANNLSGQLGSDGSTPEVRAARVGYSAQFVGENTASGPFPTAASVVAEWEDFSSTRSLMLSCDITETGVGFLYNTTNRRYYWVMDLALR